MYELAKEANKQIIAKAEVEEKAARAGEEAAAAKAKLAEVEDWLLAAELTYGEKAIKNPE